jgi:elongation factor Ts
MQCRKALEEAGGDFSKAMVILRKKGAEVAAKKADRSLGSGVVAAYIHAGGLVGAMVELSSETDFVSGNDEFKALAYNIAMQVAATNPEFLKTEEITAEARKTAAEVFAKEVQAKPAAIKEKILEGKLQAYFADKVLVNQSYIKNPEITVAGLIDAAVQKFGEKIEIRRFARFSTKG